MGPFHRMEYRCFDFISFETRNQSFPRKLQHTPGAPIRQSPYPTMKGFPVQPVGRGVFQRRVETRLEF